MAEGKLLRYISIYKSHSFFINAKAKEMFSSMEKVVVLHLQLFTCIFYIYIYKSSRNIFLMFLSCNWVHCHDQFCRLGSCLYVVLPKAQKVLFFPVFIPHSWKGQDHLHQILWVFLRIRFDCIRCSLTLEKKYFSNHIVGIDFIVNLMSTEWVEMWRKSSKMIFCLGLMRCKGSRGRQKAQ